MMKILFFILINFLAFSEDKYTISDKLKVDNFSIDLDWKSRFHTGTSKVSVSNINFNIFDRSVIKGKKFTFNLNGIKEKEESGWNDIYAEFKENNLSLGYGYLRIDMMYKHVHSFVTKKYEKNLDNYGITFNLDIDRVHFSLESNKLNLLNDIKLAPFYFLSTKFSVDNLFLNSELEYSGIHNFSGSLFTQSIESLTLRNMKIKSLEMNFGIFYSEGINYLVNAAIDLPLKYDAIPFLENVSLAFEYDGTPFVIYDKVLENKYIFKGYDENIQGLKFNDLIEKSWSLELAGIFKKDILTLTLKIRPNIKINRFFTYFSGVEEALEYIGRVVEQKFALDSEINLLMDLRAVKINSRYNHTTANVIGLPKHKLCIDGRFDFDFGHISMKYNVISERRMTISNDTYKGYKILDLVSSFDINDRIAITFEVNNILDDKSHIEGRYRVPRRNFNLGLRINN